MVSKQVCHLLVQKDSNVKKEIYSYTEPSRMCTKFTTQTKKIRKENVKFFRFSQHILLKLLPRTVPHFIRPPMVFSTYSCRHLVQRRNFREGIQRTPVLLNLVHNELYDIKCCTTVLRPMVLSWQIPRKPLFRDNFVLPWNIHLTTYPIVWHGLQYNFQFIITYKERPRRGESPGRCRCYERQRVNSVEDWGNWSLSQYFFFLWRDKEIKSVGDCGGLEHLKIETRLRDERFESVKGEYVM
jgi:hypothetical protein